MKLREASSQTYPIADEFLRDVTTLVEREMTDRQGCQKTIPVSSIASFKPPQAFHRDPRYGGDLHRADLAWAIYAASRELPETQIKDAILRARDLSKKGRLRRQLDHAERTAIKAITLVS